MSDKVLLNIDQIAIDIGVPYEENVLADGAKRYATQWDIPHMITAVGIAGQVAKQGRPVAACGGGSHWLLAAMTAAVHPLLEVYTILGLGLESEIYDLPMGEPTPEGGIRFNTRNQGESFCVDFESDDPDKPPLYGPHNYDRTLLPRVVVPAVRPEQDLYIKGTGEFSLIMTIIKAYCGKCRSINVAGAGVDGYVCAAVYGGDKKLGEVTLL